MRFAKLFLSALLLFGTLALPTSSPAQVTIGVSVRIGPPVLPVYEQPLCPGDGYIWVPGYWAYSDDGYFWVPGTWVLPPEEGLLWTPGYWAFDDGFYVWNAGYWGPTVGFYGGINYGFGYPGFGFYGGYWRGGTYYYNRSVTNVNETIVHNTYNTTVVNNDRGANRVSFNGGPGGTSARPSSTELEAARQRHVAMTSEQLQHQHAASTDRALFASVNHGRPDVAATPRPGQISRGAAPTLRNDNSNHPPNNRTNNRVETNPPENRPPANVRPNDRPNENRPPIVNNPAIVEKHQREQDKLRQQQDTERQRMQQKQAEEQQKLEQRNADAQRKQELQQRHQQQAQQLQQKHDQQQQKLQQRQQKEIQRQQPQPQQQKPEHPPHNQQ